MATEQDCRHEEEDGEEEQLSASAREASAGSTDLPGSPSSLDLLAHSSHLALRSLALRIGREVGGGQGGEGGEWSRDQPHALNAPVEVERGSR